jgi:exodeoxyribonuclease V gamma subunit
MAALRKDLERHMEGTPLPEAEQAILETVSTEVARSLEPALRLTDIPKPEEVRTDTAERASLSITAIRKFLECPVQGSARYALGLFEEEEPSDEEDEPLKQSRLDRTVLLRAAFWRAAREGIAAPDAYREGLRRRQLEGAAPTGPFAESDRTIAAGVLSAWSANVAEQELTDLDRWLVIRLGRADEFADVSEIHPPLILKLELPRPGGGTRNLEASLYGALDRCSPEFDASLRFVERGSTYDSDFLGPFLSAVALWASGLARGTSFNAYVIPGDAPRQPRIRRVFEPMGEADAKAYLARIVTDLLSEAHDYFLPAEAVFAAHKVLRSDPDALIVPAIRKVQSGTWGFHPWESGPVHFVSERFEPPSEQKAREIINRRFGPLLDTWS